MTDYANKRRWPRVDVPLLVQYRFGALEELRTEYAINVSVGGMFIASAETKPVGTRVFVQLTTRDARHFLQGEGRVVRNAEGGTAIELVGFDVEAQAVLEALVAEALARQGASGGPVASDASSGASLAKTTTKGQG